MPLGNFISEQHCVFSTVVFFFQFSQKANDDKFLRFFIFLLRCQIEKKKKKEIQSLLF